MGENFISMIKYCDGSVFNTNAQAIVNTVNCVGVMGAGLALEFQLRYPDMYLDYKKKCDDKKMRIGEVDYYNNGDIMIINFPTKWHFKYPSKIEWISSGLNSFVKTYKKYNINSVAFPKLGTNNGGLDWNIVKPLMEKYLSNIDIDIYICLDEKIEAEGLELKMVEYFNANFNLVFNQVGKISKEQIEIIKTIIPIKRFWHISKLNKIGVSTYSKIFNVCSKAVTQKGPEQLSFFDD